MKLSRKQYLRTRNWTTFLVWALQWCNENGYYCVEEEVFRHPSATHGHEKSTHRQKLAGHLLLFDIKTGQLIRDSAAYTPLGKFWKSLHQGNRWGGDFSSPDGNHFSMEHQGVA